MNSPAAAPPAGAGRGRSAPSRCASTARRSGCARRLAMSTPPVSHRKLIGKLLAGVAAAFAFGFALVPLYDALCAATGFNGKTAGAPAEKGRGGFSLGGIKGDASTNDPPSR